VRHHHGLRSTFFNPSDDGHDAYLHMLNESMQTTIVMIVALDDEVMIGLIERMLLWDT